MFEKKRMHPIAIVSNLFAGIKDFLFPIIAFIFVGLSGDMRTIFFLLIAVLFLVSAVMSAIISWFRFVYWIEDQEVRIETGVFVRKKRYIPFHRIQSISTSQGILQRLFNLVKMSIETAGGETEAVLTAIPRTEADRIQRYIKEAKMEKVQAIAGGDVAREGEQIPDEEHSATSFTEEREHIFSLSIGEVFLVALTSGGAIGVIVGVLAFASELGEYLPLDWVFDRFLQSFSSDFYTIIILIIFALVVAYLIAIIQSMLRYAHFTVEKTEENLIVSHGLLEKRSVTVPLNRVQGFVIYEGLIRKFFGLATLSIINAGVSDKDELSGEVIIAPLIERSRCADLMKRCLPEYTIDVPFTPVPERAKIRYVFRPMYIVLVPVLAGLFFLKLWGFLLLLALPLFGFLGYKAYEFAGWNITGNQLALRSRFFTARTVYVLKHRIQSLDVRRTWFQRRKELTTVLAHMLSGRGLISGKTVDVDEKDANTIYRWFRAGTVDLDEKDVMSEAE